MDLKTAIFDLKVAALEKAGAAFNFSASKNDVIFALRAEPKLEQAFSALLQREGAGTRFSYAVKQAFRKMSSWVHGNDDNSAN